jgi:uncharacterized protein YrzB (UPF0473 family)
MDNGKSNVVELVDENGNNTLFEHLMTLDYKDSEYIVLSPLDEASDQEGESQIVILRVEQDEKGDDLYLAIEDDTELNEVFIAVNEIYGQDVDIGEFEN